MGQDRFSDDRSGLSETSSEKEPRAVTEEDLNSPEFKRFFGKSILVEEDGRPEKYWFGSRRFGKDDSRNSWTFKPKAGKGNTAPMSTLGHFMTIDQVEATGYTRGEGSPHSFYVRLENPLKIKYSDLPIFEDGAAAIAYAKRKKELDG